MMSNDRHENETGWAIIDFLLSAIGVVVVSMALVFNLPQKPVESNETTSPGDVIVQLYWPEESSIDLDLWVRGPDGVPVGYSNRQSTIFNLLRDDLGKTGDLMPINQEVAYSRGKPDGRYTFNVHAFSTAGVYPVEACMEVSIRSGTGSVSKVWEGCYVFTSRYVEHTFVTLTLKDGAVVGAPSYVQTELRSANGNDRGANP